MATGERTSRATVIVTVDVEEEVLAVNQWLQRWGSRIRLSDNDGCGCCVDIWHVEAPAAALAELPRGVVSEAANGA